MPITMKEVGKGFGRQFGQIGLGLKSPLKEGLTPYKKRKVKRRTSRPSLEELTTKQRFKEFEKKKKRKKGKGRRIVVVVKR